MTGITEPLSTITTAIAVSELATFSPLNGSEVAVINQVINGTKYTRTIPFAALVNSVALLSSQMPSWLGYSATCGEPTGTILPGTPVYISSSGSFRVANNASIATASVIGLVSDSCMFGNIILVATSGVFSQSTSSWDAIITGATSGLIPGETYYLDPNTAGFITPTAPSSPIDTGKYLMPIGIALSTTDLRITSVDSPILL